MKRFLSALALLCLAVVFTPARAAEDYPGTIQKFKGAGPASKFFDSAYGYAVFPTIGKAGFIFGGAFGRGQVYMKGGEHVGNAAMTQATVGFQFGGQSYSQVIFFQNEEAFKRFTTGKFEFGADAQVVVITSGASARFNTAGSSASTSTDAQYATGGGDYNNGMATFILPKGGLMLDASLGGQKFDYKALE